MRAPARWTIYNGRYARERLAAVNGRAILPGAWIVAAVLTVAGCAADGSPTGPADVDCAWRSVNHSGVAECHVGPAPAVADVVGSDRIETAQHLDL